jgi:hypothetical protein
MNADLWRHRRTSANLPPLRCTQQCLQVSWLSVSRTTAVVLTLHTSAVILTSAVTAVLASVGWSRCINNRYDSDMLHTREDI